MILSNKALLFLFFVFYLFIYCFIIIILVLKKRKFQKSKGNFFKCSVLKRKSKI